jgi:hypothetical protein
MEKGMKHLLSSILLGLSLIVIGCNENTLQTF